MNIQYDDTNIFAKIMRNEIPSNKLYEDDDTLVIMDIMPRADGHCLVLPKKHARNILDIEAQSLAAVALTTQRMAHAVKSAFNADGVTILQFNEAAGGQEVFHLHVHVIPRHEGKKLGPAATTMAESAVLNANADKIRAAL